MHWLEVGLAVHVETGAGAGERMVAAVQESMSIAAVVVSLVILVEN